MFGAARAGRPLLDPMIVDLLRAEPVASRVAAIGGGLLLVLIGLTWAARSVRPERRPDVVVDGGRPETRIVVNAVAVAEALAAQADGLPGVHRARARLVGSESAPALRVTLWLTEDADVRALLDRIDDTLLASARESLDLAVAPGGRAPGAGRAEHPAPGAVTARSPRPYPWYGRLEQRSRRRGGHVGRAPRRAVAVVLAGLAVLAAGCTVGPSQRPPVAVRGESMPAPPPAAAQPPPPPPTLPEPSARRPTIPFYECTDDVLATLPAPLPAGRTLQIDCGEIAVPADHEQPGRGRVSLNVVSVGAPGAPRDRPALVVLGDTAGESSALAAVEMAGQVDPALLRPLRAGRAWTAAGPARTCWTARRWTPGPRSWTPISTAAATPS